MSKIALIVLLLAGLSNAYGAPLRPRQQRQQKLQPGLRPNAAPRRALVEDAVLGFYVNQFQQAVQAGEVTSEVFTRILPFLQQFVHDRFEISQRRTRALNQLRLAIERNAADDELKRLVRDLDLADAEFQLNQEKFFTNVDPLLNARQQAKIRILQNMADNRIRQILNAVQPPVQRPGAAPATNPD